MNKFSVADLAYAAGMVDGDGCISVNKGSVAQKSGSRSFMITVRVSQKLDEIPLWFLATFGGRVREVGREKTFTNAAGRSIKTVPMFAWEVYCQDAADFLEAILPYLQMKKYRASLAVDLARMQQRRTKKNGIYRREVTPEENEDRERIALAIRAENMKGNTRVAMMSKWGVN